MSFFAVAAMGFLVSYLLTFRIASRSTTTAFDEPNERSLHGVPTLRLGGVGILAGVAASLAAAWALAGPGVYGSAWPVALGAACVVAVGFRDDLRGASIFTRLVAQSLAAGILVVAWGAPAALELPGIRWQWPEEVAAGFTILFVVWMINLYNFMDGIDGLAAGMAVAGFTAYMLLSHRAGREPMALAASGVAGAAGGFLVHNFPPSRIFMGDTGSTLLGYLAAAFAIWAERAGVFPLWVAVVAFSPFVVDATATIVRRALAGQPVWRPHRSHYYQRLVLAGWSHRRTTLCGYVIMTLAAVSAMMAPRLSVPGQWQLLGAWALLYAVIGWMITRLELRGLQSVS